MAEQMNLMNQINDQRRVIEHMEQVKKRIKDFAIGISVCTGDNRDDLRRWLSQIDDVRQWTNAPDSLIIDLAGQLSTGALFKALIRARDGLQGPQVTWPNVRALVSTQFLDADEPQYLQARLDKCIQQPFEDVGAYTRRFQNQVDMAYADDEVNVPCVRNRLISLYVGGLKDQAVRQQVCVVRHATLLQAQTSAQDVERSFKVSMSEARGIQQQQGIVQRQEEPMDISAVTANIQQSLQQTLDKAVKQLAQQMGTVQGELKSLRKLSTMPGAATPSSSIGNEHLSQAHPPGIPQQGYTTHAQAASQQPPWWYNQPPAWVSQQQPQQQHQGQQQHQMQQQQQPQSHPAYAQNRPRRRCYECGSFDHMIRDCQQRHTSIQAAVQAVLDQRFGTQPKPAGN